MKYAALALLLIATPAVAKIEKQTGMMFCGPVAEIRATLDAYGYKPLMRGVQGSAGKGIGEVLVNSKSEWFVVQFVDDTACVVLGGQDLKPVDSKKEGEKS